MRQGKHFSKIALLRAELVDCIASDAGLGGVHPGLPEICCFCCHIHGSSHNIVSRVFIDIIYIYIYIYIYVYVYVCIYISINVYIYIIRISIHAYIHINNIYDIRVCV